MGVVSPLDASRGGHSSPRRLSGRVVRTLELFGREWSNPWNAPRILFPDFRVAGYLVYKSLICKGVIA
jgi:hypothetical protein